MYKEANLNSHHEMKHDFQQKITGHCPLCLSTKTTSFGTRQEYAQQRSHLFSFEFEDVVCSDCDFVFSRKRPSPKYLSEYYSEYLPSLSQLSEQEIEFRMKILSPFLYEKTKVLELGGGFSSFSDRLSNNGSIAFQSDPSLDVEHPTTEESFDIVCSYYVGEHVLDVKLWIQEQATLVRQGGRILIEVPNFMAHPRESLNNEHINHFQMKHLKALISACGLTVESYNEHQASRYFGMWILARKKGAIGACTATQKNILGTHLAKEVLAAARREMADDRKRLREEGEDIASELGTGRVVGFWPCNEKTTNMLMSLGSNNLNNLRLFDVDPHKTGINWAEKGIAVARPDPHRISECDAFYLFSPSSNDAIKTAIEKSHICPSGIKIKDLSS